MGGVRGNRTRWPLLVAGEGGGGGGGSSQLTTLSVIASRTGKCTSVKEMGGKY